MSAVASAQPVNSTRTKAVEQAGAAWIRKLIDLSRRNNLLYYRSLKTGTLDLTGASASALRDLWRGQSVALADLFPESSELARLSGCAWEIRRKALENQEERGLVTLYVALGSAGWPAADGGRDVDAPVLLVPVVVESRGREGHNLALKREGDLQANAVLLHALEAERGLRVAGEALVEVAEPARESNGGRPNGDLHPERAYALLREQCRSLPGFRVSERCVLGNFSFQKMAIVRDLQASSAAMAAHDLVAALAGVAEAKEAVRGRQTAVDARALDAVPPESEFLVLDADSSQQRVIQSVLAGQDGVIQGPPGTGKSQTIANLIAELAARGKRVLFVAEKRAALQVVLDRLERSGLGHLALDLHGAEVSRREVMASLAASLDAVHSAVATNGQDLFDRFSRVRERLNSHALRLHAPRKPSGLSVFALQGRILATQGDTPSETRWRGAELDRLDVAAATASQEDLRDLGGLATLFLGTDASPWTGARLGDAATAQALSDLSRNLTGLLGQLVGETERVAREAGFVPATTVHQLDADLALCARAERLLEEYDTRLLERPEVLARALAPADRPLRRAWAWISDAEYRGAVRQMRAMSRAGRAPARSLLADAVAARDLVAAWRKRAGGPARPRAPRGLAGVRALARQVREGLARLDQVLAGTKLGELPLAGLPSRVAALAADTVTPLRVVRVGELVKRLESRGLQPLLAELRHRQRPPESWGSTFEHAWLSSCLDRVRAEDPEVAAFSGRSHDRDVAEFQELDERRIKLAVARVVRAHAERAVAAMNGNPEGESLVRREAAKRSRHVPLRKLVEQAGDVVSALRPCWMASPLSVSQLLPGGGEPLFDVVLFDEASQILPEDAVAALLRGRKAVVAGDQEQLPPTTFFAAQEEDAETDEEAATVGFESLLDLMVGLGSKWTLDWHYRSLDESLIAFSNRNIYGDRLVTFPGLGRLHGLSHVLVQRDLERDGEEESSSAEVRRVVDLVLEHARSRPEESLGVIAMGLRHARRIEAELDRVREDHPELDPFFASDRKERFFVKNLERVQGDERDAIVLSVGYGKDRAGKLVYRFGPLLSEGGHRRLNVAVTRARRRMTVVSSFSHRDMDPARCKAKGMELLRLYLEYAASGGRVLGGGRVPEVEMNEFERDVFGALSAQGLALEPQWGCSRYRIDFAVKHPDEPGRFVLAIECDGATYHSAPTARDRDRLRQKHLEALGWRFHRIWSTDWFLSRESEVARAVEAYQEALRRVPEIWAPAAPTGSTPLPGVWREDPPPSSRGRRGPRPAVPRRGSIEEYSDNEIIRIIEWIESGTLRTVQQLIEETVEELGFKRRGHRIVARVRDLIARVHARRGAA